MRDRPADRGRLLLRLPRGEAVHARGPRRHREEDGAHRQAEPADREEAPPEGRGARAVREEGPDAEVRADPRRSPATPSSATRWASSSTSASGRTSPSTKDIKAFKLKGEPAAAYWKGKEGNPSMQRIYGYAFFTKEELDQHLFRIEEAKRRDHRKLGRELDLFSIAGRDGGRARALAPEGRLRPQADRGLLARRAPRGRLRPRLLAAHRAARPVEDERAHRVLQGEHVLADRDRERRVPAQADELPVPPDDLQVAAAQLPRPAVSLGGARDGLPLRALGRPARPHARAGLHPGRRAHLLPARPARGRDPPRARLRHEHPAHLRLRPLRHLPLDEAGEGERQRRAVGGRDGGAAQGARDAAACRTRSTPARASSTAPRSTSRSRTRSTAPGSARRSRWTSTTRRGSSSSTSPRTARPTSR